MSGSLGIAEVFQAHAAFVLRVVRRLGVPPGDVEDAAQEVFIVVQQKLAQYDPQRPLRPWLFGIASRVALGHRRRLQTAQNRAELDLPEPGAAPGPSRGLEISEARRTLERALAQLDDVKRAVFVAFDLEGLPMNEIAEEQGCPLQTAYARLYAARKVVKQVVEQEADRERRHG